MSSIFDDMNEMKRLADEIIGKGEKVIEKRTQDSDTRKYMPYGFCDDCGTPLEHEPAWHGTFDQPPSTGGFWCPECEKWT